MSSTIDDMQYAIVNDDDPADDPEIVNAMNAIARHASTVFVPTASTFAGIGPVEAQVLTEIGDLPWAELWDELEELGGDCSLANTYEPIL